MTLRNQLVILAYENPGTVREALLPILRTSARKRPVVKPPTVRSPLYNDLMVACADIPSVDLPELVSAIESDIRKGVKEEFYSLVKDIDTFPKGKWKLGRRETEYASYPAQDGYDTWDISVEVEFPSKISWTVSASGDLSEMLERSLEEVKDWYSLKRSDLAPVLRNSKIHMRLQELWEEAIQGGSEFDPYAHWPIFQAVEDFWHQKINIDVDWDDEAPYNENPIQYKLVDSWQHSRVLVAKSAGGVEAQYTSRVSVRFD